MLCHIPLCSKSSGESAVNSFPSRILVNIEAIDNGLYKTPNGFVPMLNFLSANMVPIFPAKHEPASSRLFLWLMQCSFFGSSTAVLKRVIVSYRAIHFLQIIAKIMNFIKNYCIFVRKSAKIYTFVECIVCC